MANRASDNTDAVSDTRRPAPAPKRPERPEPPQPPEPQHDREHFRTLVALLIAVGSILGALVVWRASAAFDSSTGLRRESDRQLLLRSSIVGRIDGWIGQDLQLFTLYLEELHEADLLREQAADLAPTDPTGADDLRDTAFDHLAIARSLRLTFRAVRPDLYVEGAEIRFDTGCRSTELAECIDDVRERLLANEINLLALDPNGTRQRAHDAQTRSIQLVIVAAGFVFAVLVLTLARSGVHRHRVTATVGLFVMLASGIAWGLIERGLR